MAVIGGWTQTTSATAPPSFSYTMYGMVTNLAGLTTGTPSAPGWSPADLQAPSGPGKVLWTYGGAGCTPSGMPSGGPAIDQIVSATTAKGWAGVDFDDECGMSIDGLEQAVQTLGQQQLGTSYTFLAGWAYNHPDQSPEGKAANAAVQRMVQAGAERLVLMCYGNAMWSMQDIEANVGPAIARTISDNGAAPGRVILALTPAGLNQQNLGYFLDQVKSNGIGGLFVWEFPSLSPADLQTIEQKLGIS